MRKLIIHGGTSLQGSIQVQGAKNSVLPLLAAALVSGGECEFENCPELRDVDVTIEILKHLGCRVRREGSTVLVNAETVTRSDIPDALMHEMRSSVIFLGAILTRTGQAELSHPGGCELGARPIDLHLKALRDMGMEVTEKEERISCRAGTPTGCTIEFPFPSVGATENAMLAGLRCDGTVTIVNAAREPEIVDLQRFLQAMGARVEGAGSSTITIQGKAPYHGVRYRVMPDRIVTATWLAAAAVTGGEVFVKGARKSDLESILDVLEETGCELCAGADGIELKSPARLKAASPIITAPYPGFPTDAQAPLMAALLRSEGTTVFEENIFENRYRHVDEMKKMGALIRVDGRGAKVTGVPSLHGASVRATDLRGGAALVIAALAAEGVSEITGLEHIGRGYERLDENLTSLGAAIKRLDIT